jgi:Ni/Fe-hydrogenase subunit HybB-like protein
VTDANNTRLIVTRAVLWIFVGIAMAIAAARYARGLGATTALTDANPWGLWIGFDILGGVALAAGGFVIAATVYIFHLEKYRALVRPAVLTAFLGYVAVALGLMVDLGRPWNIWRPIVSWQFDSPLFEVAWCVMLYLTVLALEFLPVVFEGLEWRRCFRFMRRITLGLVIVGIGLSTLHQSSLGTLFLLAKDRLHPLWYSPVQPLLFFVSAVGLGLVTVITESCVSSWLYHREGEWPLLRGLTRAAAVVIGLYGILRLGDLVLRGQIHHLSDGSWITLLFVVEILLSVMIPVLLFTVRPAREQTWAMTTGALVGVAGFILHRANVGGIAHIPATGEAYLPSVAEISVSLGLVAGMALVFLFFVERFPVWDETPARPDHFTPPVPDPVSRTYFGGYWFGRAHLAAASWIIGVVLGVGLLEATTAGDDLALEVPVRPPRAVAALRVASHGQPSSRLVLLGMTGAAVEIPEGFTTGLLIDGDRDGAAVVFDHDGHRSRLGGQASCGRCHHRNLRLDRGTPCAVCHADMYRCTDTFNHELHVLSLGYNASCARCHPRPDVAKTREHATPCLECHESEIYDCFTETTHPCVGHSHSGEAVCDGCHDAPESGAVDEVSVHRSRCGIAPGYRLAMHGLCIKCHCIHQAEAGIEDSHMTRCACCHQEAGLDTTVRPDSATEIRIADGRRAPQ